jgi:uncharacterized protein YegL
MPRRRSSDSAKKWNLPAEIAKKNETSYIVDRIEGSKAVLETKDGSTFNAPVKWLPEKVREGSRVTLNKDGTFRLTQARSKSLSMMKTLKAKE